MSVQTISVGGRAFPVPLLSLGQLKFVVPAMLRLKSMNIDALTEDNVADLTKITYLAILRGTPTFPEAEFMSMAGTVGDLLMAYPIIAQQCGMVQKQDAEPGEATAGRSTGITS